MRPSTPVRAAADDPADDGAVAGDVGDDDDGDGDDVLVLDPLGTRFMI